MYKKIIIVIVLLLLVGCGENEHLDSLKTDMEEMKQTIESIKQTNEALNNRINLLISDADDKNKTIQEMQSIIDNLNQSKYSYYTSAYRDYLVSFAYDVVRELESYSNYYGIISNYDQDLETIEVASVEFVYVNDYKRIEELNIDINETAVHGDTYMYIAYDEKQSYELSEHFKLYIYDWNGNGGLKPKSLKQEIEETSEYDPIYIISMIGNKIIRVTEYRID